MKRDPTAQGAWLSHPNGRSSQRRSVSQVIQLHSTRWGPFLWPSSFSLVRLLKQVDAQNPKWRHSLEAKKWRVDKISYCQGPVVSWEKNTRYHRPRIAKRPCPQGQLWSIEVNCLQHFKEFVPGCYDRLVMSARHLESRSNNLYGMYLLTLFSEAIIPWWTVKETDSFLNFCS